MKCNAKLVIKQMILVICCLWGLGACQQGTDENGVHLNDDTMNMGALVAEVGDKKIYDVDIDYEILSMPESMRYLMQDAPARAKVLDVMVKRIVIAQKARDMGLSLDPLIAYRMAQAEDAVLLESLRRWQYDKNNNLSEEEIMAYYEQHLHDFSVLEQVHVRHILVEDKQTALAIVRQLKVDSERFPALATELSIDDGTKANGGDLKWFERGTMVKPFEASAFALTANKRLSQPVKTEFGWHVIEWLGHREGRIPDLKSVRDEIVSILEKQHLDSWIEKLMMEADITMLNPKADVLPLQRDSF